MKTTYRKKIPDLVIVHKDVVKMINEQGNVIGECEAPIKLRHKLYLSLRASSRRMSIQDIYDYCSERRSN